MSYSRRNEIIADEWCEEIAMDYDARDGRSQNYHAPELDDDEIIILPEE